MFTWLRNFSRIRKRNVALGSHPNRDAPWIAVDLDGTLAEYTGWRGIWHIGQPVPLMKQRVLAWIEAGYVIKVFTARASVPDGVAPVKEWLARNGFPDLEVTNCKDFQMIELWDDRAIQVISNTGHPVVCASINAKPNAPLLADEQARRTLAIGRLAKFEEKS